MSSAPARARVIRFPLATDAGRRRPGESADLAARRFGALLELRGPDGRSGWGEASPLVGYAAGSPSEAAAVLLRLLADSSAMSALYRSIDGLAHEATGDRHSGTGAAAADVLNGPLAESPAARAAVVSAMYDLAGRRVGLPTHELLLRSATPAAGDGRRTDASVSDDPGQVHSTAGYPVNALIPLTGRREMLAAAAEARGRGIQVLKAKLGTGERLDDELELLRLLRIEFGSQLTLRLDANGRWTPAEVLRNLERIAPLNPEYVEEPVSGAALVALAGSAVPLAADESLRDPEIADALLESGEVSVFVLKPSLLGGVDRCLDLGRRAVDLGRRCVVTHSFEGPVGHGAACEAALALAALGSGGARTNGLAQGLDRIGVLDQWTDVAVPQLRGARLVPAEVSGHGIDPVSLIEKAAGDGRI